MTLPADRPTSQSTDQSLASTWSFFDKIYCITLDSRPDRRRQAHAQFEVVGLSELVEFVVVEKHASDSEEGIFESHMSCLRQALASGARHIVIFEDDILFHHFSPIILSRAVQFMAAEKPWQLFFFGCFVRSSRRSGHRSVVQVKYRCTAHGYVVNRPFAELLVQQPWAGVAYDDLLRAMTDDHVYASYPSFAYQSGSSTDNDKLLGIDRIRRLLGGVRRLQRWNEFGYRYFVELVVVHLAALLLLVLAILLARRGYRLH